MDRFGQRYFQGMLAATFWAHQRETLHLSYAACYLPSQGVQGQRPQIGQWLDRFGERYSKGVLAATFLALAGLPLLGVPMRSTPTQVS